MAAEQWTVAPGESLVLELDDVTRFKSALIGGVIDVIGTDDATTRLEIADVEGRDVEIRLEDGRLVVDHPRLDFDRFIDAVTGRGDRPQQWGGYGRSKARVSVALPRRAHAELGQVSASALVSGLIRGVQCNSVSGEQQLESVTGRVDANSVSGEIAIVNHQGEINVHTVSGDVTATGRIDTFAMNTVSGKAFVDAVGPTQRIDVNTVSGSVTVRVDAGAPIELDANSASGSLTVDALAFPKSAKQRIEGDDRIPAVRIQVNGVSSRVAVMRRTGVAA